MYELSFGKCVCFIFLVILAFLGCSGFPIDRRLSTMSGDVSAWNSYTSVSVTDSPSASYSNHFLERLFTTSKNYLRKSNTAPYNTFQSNSYVRPSTIGQTRQLRLRHHRIRHSSHQQIMKSRHPEAQATHVNERPKPSGKIETLIFPPPLSSTRVVNDLEPYRLTNGPLSKGATSYDEDDVRRIVSRPQRSSDKKRSRKRSYRCQRQDVGRKAYIANTVVRAKAESMSSNRIHNYSVTFRILEKFKTPFAIDDTLRLTFYNDTKDMNCESEVSERTHGLVKAQILQSKEYFLFLDSDGMHNYSLVGMPVLKKKRIKDRKNRDLEEIRRITRKNFVLKAPKIPAIVNKTPNLKPGKKLRLVCKFRGFPTPKVLWRKDGHMLHPNARTRISYKRKKTTLVINGVQMKDAGVYQCVTRGVDGRTTHANETVRISNSEQKHEECEEKYKESFCLNGGTCVIVMPGERGCWCPDGFTGKRCEEKDVTNHSSMSFPCKVGVTTTYYC
ncbi:protein vein isoform X2 [Agrilus planipennis]|uniref:Protein vein isoform X2 n=1 Tax=Agrilus planipennis TaxID=224129 RepID=A0A1W4X0F6_AGRPL|nr:protein vein isoform X2 [Agrilus planipennis]